MNVPKAGIVRRPKELDAFCREVVTILNALSAPAEVSYTAEAEKQETEPVQETEQ